MNGDDIDELLELTASSIAFLMVSLDTHHVAEHGQAEEEGAVVIRIGFTAGNPD